MAEEEAVPEEEAVAFSATSTLNDTLAAEFVAPLRPWRKALRKHPVLMILGGATVGLGIGIFTSSDDPTDVARMLLSKKWGGFALALLATFILFFLGVQKALKVFNRAMKRRRYAQRRRAHPACDAADPALPITRAYRFDETGMTTSTPYDELWESWGGITGLDETAELMIVRVGRGTISYPLPKRELAPELRERLQRYVDSRSSSKWPF